MILFLAKFFSKREYADEFVRGKMYVNRLSYFKKLENLDGRGDELEGAIVAQLDGLVITMKITEPSTGAVEEFTIPVEDLAAPPIISPEWFDYINVYCMYAGHNGDFAEVTSSNLQEFRRHLQIPKDNELLGRQAVFIIDTPEFLRRVKTAADREGYRIYGRLVTYYDPEIGTPPLRSNVETIFHKRKEYEYQREFRIALYTGTVGCSAITLDIGDISDIAIQMDTIETIKHMDWKIVPES